MNDAHQDWISRSVSGIRISPIKEMAMRSAAVEGAAWLTWGLPSFRTPEYIRRAVAERLESDTEIGKYALSHLFSYVRPEGASYVFPRLVVDHADSYAFSIELLENARVTATPGIAFGSAGEHHVRMAYCVTDETVDLAFDRIESYFGRK